MSGGYSTTVDGTNVYVGSGNVYDDLGLDDADELFAKAQLAHQINTIIKERGWTRAQAAASLGVSQPNISLLARGRLCNFSFDRLSPAAPLPSMPGIGSQAVIGARR